MIYRDVRINRLEIFIFDPVFNIFLCECVHVQVYVCAL